MWEICAHIQLFPPKTQHTQNTQIGGRRRRTQHPHHQHQNIPVIFDEIKHCKHLPTCTKKIRNEKTHQLPQTRQNIIP